MNAQLAAGVRGAPGAAWLMAIAVPPTVTAPTRAALVVFSATCSEMVPLPRPEPLCTVIHGTDGCAVQVQVAWLAVTRTVSTDAAAVNDRATGSSVNVQPGAGVAPPAPAWRTV